MSDTLVDASYLVALGYPRDRHHRQAIEFAATWQQELLIPDVVLVEAIYNLQRLGSIQAAVRFGELLATQEGEFVPLSKSDFTRAVALMHQYRSVDLDFVDCCLTSLAERLGINRICTFDRRDFMIIRPRHVEYFELLP